MAQLLLMEKKLMLDAERSKLIINPNCKVKDFGNATNIDLLTYWTMGQASNTLRWGVNHAVGLDCIKPRVNSCALEYMLDYKPVAKHDFSKGALVLPITLRIRNALDRGSITFLFETLHPGEIFSQQDRKFQRLTDQNLRGRYFWTGCTRKRVAQLQAQQSVELELTATFFHPATYNLNRFQFLVERDGSKPKLFFFPLQHLVSVHDSVSE